MQQAEFEQHVGRGNISPSIAAALERAKVLYDQVEHHRLQTLGASSADDREIR
jgi:hypothetical protein